MKNADGTTTPREKVLVSGATGFIGTHLIDALLREGYGVRALVRRRDGAPDPTRAELFQGDLRDPASLEGVEQGIDVVVHCASLLGKWGTDEALLHAVNVQGTVNLLQRFEGRRLRRFVHLSAGGVSGPVSGGAVDETYDCRPATAYESTKLLAERKALEISRGAGIPATVLRPTFTYGPGDPHKLALFRTVKKGRYAFIGSGESVNHPIYIDDLIAGILLGIARARAGEIYIIGGERPVTKRELVHTIADALGVRRPSLRIPRGLAGLAAPVFEALGRTFRFDPVLTRSRVMMMADDFGYSIEKARSELGYEPKTSLRDGIARTVEYYRESGLL